jgi:hypothetical protein
MRSRDLAAHGLVLSLLAACGSPGDGAGSWSGSSNASRSPGNPPSAWRAPQVEPGNEASSSGGGASSNGGGASLRGASSSETAPNTAASSGGGPGVTPEPDCAANPNQIVDFAELAREVGARIIGANPLAVDDTNIYFVFDDALMRVPIHGGSVTTMAKLGIASGSTLQNVALVLTPTSVALHYPVSGGIDETVVGVSIQGSASTTLATSSGRISAFGGDGQTIYFVDRDGTKSVPAAGGSVKLLTDQLAAADGTGFGLALAVVGSNVIVTSSAQGGSVVAVPIQGGPPATLATLQPNASFPMHCGSGVCWWTGATPAGNAGTPGPGAIAQLDAGGNLTSLPQAPYFPWSLVFDGTDFFETVACDVCDGSLVRIPGAGGPSVSMGHGTFVAVHGACSYLSSVEGIWTANKAYVAPGP